MPQLRTASRPGPGFGRSGTPGPILMGGVIAVGGITTVGGLTMMAGPPLPGSSGSTFGLALFLSGFDLVDDVFGVPGSATGADGGAVGGVATGAGGVGAGVVGAVGAGVAGGEGGGDAGLSGLGGGGVVPSAPGAGLGFFGLSGVCARADKDTPRHTVMINEGMRVFMVGCGIYAASDASAGL